MHMHRTAQLLAALLTVCAAAGVGQAQDSRTASNGPAMPAAIEAGDSIGTAAGDTVSKKHGGLFGKVKSVAKNKVVRQVAKVAACTMVPGGQVVAGAIDAASATGAAGAAQGVAGAASGSSCMPGGAAGLAGGMPAGGLPGGTLAGAAPMPSAAQLAAMQAGGAGSVAGQAMMAVQIQQMQQMMSAQMMSEQQAAAGATMSEAPGQNVELSPDLAADLAKGKTIVRNIDWIAGAPGISSAGMLGFAGAMARLAAVMAQVGGSYRLDLYLDRRYEDAIVETLGARRLSTVEAAISDGSGGAQPTLRVEAGEIRKDKHPRLEIVRQKD